MLLKSDSLLSGLTDSFTNLPVAEANLFEGLLSNEPSDRKLQPNNIKSMQILPKHVMEATHSHPKGTEEGSLQGEDTCFNCPLWCP